MLVNYLKYYYIHNGLIILIVFILSLTSKDIGRYAKQWNREYIVMRFGVYAYQLNDIG